LAVPILETARLALRRIGEGDAGFMLGLLNEPSFIRFIGDRGVRTLDQAREYILLGPVASYRRHGFGLWLAELKPQRQPIGVCGLVRRDGLDDADIGFAFLPDYRSRGLATEAASAVMDHARSEFRLDRIVAVVAPDNAASIRVLEKLGLRSEKMIRLPGDEAELNLFAWNR
jgi:RimJ/RimL family protein N-acetyltransferase